MELFIAGCVISLILFAIVFVQNISQEKEIQNLKQLVGKRSDYSKVDERLEELEKGTRRWRDSASQINLGDGQAIADRAVALLKAGDNQFANSVVDRIVVEMVQSDYLRARLLEKISVGVPAGIDNVLADAVKRLADDEDDGFQEVVREHFSEWLKTAWQDSAAREKLSSAVIQAVEEHIADIVQWLRDNEDTLEDFVRDKLPEVLSLELAKPESKLREELVAAVIENAVNGLQS